MKYSRYSGFFRDDSQYWQFGLSVQIRRSQDSDIHAVHRLQHRQRDESNDCAKRQDQCRLDEPHE